MLRASVERSEGTVDLRAVVDPTVDSGITHGKALLNFAAAVVGDARAQLSVARQALRAALGDGALVQASAIIANFAMNDRAANAIGIVLEPMFVRGSVEFRAQLGIDLYPSALNTLRA